MSVTVHGQKQFVSAEPRNVVDVFLGLWLAASSAGDGAATAAAGGAGTKAAEKRTGAIAEVQLSSPAADL